MGVAEREFGRIWPTHVDALIAFLTRLRVSFDGDLDAALMMAVIGSAALPRGRMPDDLTFDAFQMMEKRDVFYTPLNRFRSPRSPGSRAKPPAASWQPWSAGAGSGKTPRAIGMSIPGARRNSSP
jgi:hypothetical protein